MDTYYRIQEEILDFIKSKDIDRAIAHCEEQFKLLPKTDYHRALGRDWLHQTQAMSDWIGSFYEKASQKISVRTIYCEMNRFEINTDMWYVDALAYDVFESMDRMSDWLSDWNESTNSEEPFELTGVEDLQKLFYRDYCSCDGYFAIGSEEGMPEDIEASSEAAILLLTLRMQQLIHAATQLARKAGKLPEDVAVLSTAHEEDMILRS